MKLLFDENLSPRLVSLLAEVYPGSAHVHQLNLGKSEDIDIWAFAAAEGFTIVPKDWDAILQKFCCCESGTARYRTQPVCSASGTS